MNPAHILLIVFTGLVSGTLGGLLGIGGGVIMVPLFYYGLSMELPRAIGTSLTVIIATAMAGSFTHWQQQHVDLKVAAGVALFAVIGSILGATLTSHLATPILKKTLAIVLAITSIKLFLER